MHSYAFQLSLPEVQGEPKPIPHTTSPQSLSPPPPPPPPHSQKNKSQKTYKKKSKKLKIKLTGFNGFSHHHDHIPRLEICAAFIALLLAPFLATRLPLSISFLAGVVARPLFVFSLGNAIIVSLIAKSGKFKTNHSNARDEIGSAIFESLGSEPESFPVVFEDKEMISQKPDSDSLALTVIAEAEKEKDDIKVAEMAAVAEVVEDTVRQLESDVAAAEEEVTEEDGMSDEEFQRAIEDFIAKQMRFRREESKTVVLFSGHR